MTSPGKEEAAPCREEEATAGLGRFSTGCNLETGESSHHPLPSRIKMGYVVFLCYREGALGERGRKLVLPDLGESTDQWPFG